MTSIGLSLTDSELREVIDWLFEQYGSLSPRDDRSYFSSGYGWTVYAPRSSDLGQTWACVMIDSPTSAVAFTLRFSDHVISR